MWTAIGARLPHSVALAGGERLQEPLGRTRTWLGDSMTAIGVVVLVVLGDRFLGGGLRILER